MRYRRIGRSDVEVSEVGFGCGDTAGIMIRAEPAEQRRAVARAVELGVTYFDTGPSYGKGASEANLGRVLKELGVRPLIATKVDVMPHQLDDLAAAIVRNTERSLARLGVDYVDVLQVHNAPTNVRRPPGVYGFEQMWVEDYLRPGGALEGLERVRRQGKARLVGFTAESMDHEAVARLLDCVAVDIIGLPFHLLNPTAGVAKPDGLEVSRDFHQLIDRAQRMGVGVASFGPLGLGVLSDAALAGQPRHPIGGGPIYADTARYERDLARGRQLAFLSRPGRSLAQAAVQFVLKQRGVSTAIGGFSSVDHLEEIVASQHAADLLEAEWHRLTMLWETNFGEQSTAVAG
jgi:L-glyceraldehyde 3-phosphate reductase